MNILVDGPSDCSSTLKTRQLGAKTDAENTSQAHHAANLATHSYTSSSFAAGKLFAESALRVTWMNV